MNCRFTANSLSYTGFNRPEVIGMELLARFVIGGLVVTAFAIIGDMLKPLSFAGLFPPRLPLLSLPSAWRLFPKAVLMRRRKSIR